MIWVKTRIKRPMNIKSRAIHSIILANIILRKNRLITSYKKQMSILQPKKCYKYFFLIFDYSKLPLVAERKKKQGESFIFLSKISKKNLTFVGLCLCCNGNRWGWSLRRWANDVATAEPFPVVATKTPRVDEGDDPIWALFGWELATLCRGNRSWSVEWLKCRLQKRVIGRATVEHRCNDKKRVKKLF